MTYDARATPMPPELRGRVERLLARSLPPPSQRTTTREEGRTMETGYELTSHELAAKEQIGIIEDLDRELERLDKLAADYDNRLGPISNQYNLKNASADTPRPEPSSQLRGRVERLRDISARLDRTLRDIEL